jgi:predicted DNA-binding transcriptional regulator AlpA
MEDQFNLDLDNQLIARFLGPKYLGRRYLKYSEIVDLGLADNRAVLQKWMAAGVFPRCLKLAGPRGRSLRWLASEVAALIAERVAERDGSSSTETDDRADRPNDDEKGPVAGGASGPFCISIGAGSPPERDEYEVTNHEYPTGRPAASSR